GRCSCSSRCSQGLRGKDDPVRLLYVPCGLLRWSYLRIRYRNLWWGGGHGFFLGEVLPCRLSEAEAGDGHQPVLQVR
ncbi:unnamed protein product, partial [Musa acuminata subsp. burmannicoides]